MSGFADLLFEIGGEELPPKALQRLSESLTASVVKGLDDRGIAHGDARSLATPRRLAVIVEGVETQQADRQEQRLGPAIAAAFDENGQPKPAAIGFAKSCGIEVESLSRVEGPKGERLAASINIAGAKTADELPTILDAALNGLPIPKRMRWGNNEENFSRPVHWLLLILGGEVVPYQRFGLTAGRVTRGHRFHCPEPIIVPEAAAYVGELADPGHVIADFSTRREQIAEQVSALASKMGGRAELDDDLLDEVTALVEWPVAISGQYEERFLGLPPEVLITTVESHQRYFVVTDNDGKLLPRFITVANIRSENPKLVVEGNERVVRPRLEDALFFWNRDRAQPLEAFCSGLANVTYQKGLGSLADKTARLDALAQKLASACEADTEKLARAAQLSKADLLTDMVYEFTELQGTMGRYYARACGEAPEVAQAIEEHYMPRFAGDHLPGTDTGRALALADRLDTLSGIFALGKKPTGDRDPFGLRRAALGVIRILIENQLDLDIRPLLIEAIDAQPVTVDQEQVFGNVQEFLLDRLRGWALDEGFSKEQFEAVCATMLARQSLNLHDFAHRLAALRAFVDQPENQDLAAAHKRVRNILGKAEAEDIADAVTEGLLTESAEKALHEALTKATENFALDFELRNYRSILSQLAGLRDAVDQFFDDIMVNAEDSAIRANRLALLSELDQLCRSVADISKLSAGN